LLYKYNKILLINSKNYSCNSSGLIHLYLLMQMKKINVTGLCEFTYDKDENLWFGVIQEDDKLILALNKAGILFSAIDLALPGNETEVFFSAIEKALLVINKLPQFVGELPGRLIEHAKQINVDLMATDSWQLLEIRIIEPANVLTYSISFGGDSDTYGWWAIFFEDHKVVRVERTSY